MELNGHLQVHIMISMKKELITVLTAGRCYLIQTPNLNQVVVGLALATLLI